MSEQKDDGAAPPSAAAAAAASKTNGTSSDPRVKKILIDLRTELGISEDIRSQLENQKKLKQDSNPLWDQMCELMKPVPGETSQEEEDRKKRNEVIFRSLEAGAKLFLNMRAEKAYFNTLKAFIAQSTPISKNRDDILLNLSKEWNIDTETHENFLIQIKDIHPSKSSRVESKRKEPVAVACSICNRDHFFSKRLLQQHELTCLQIEKNQLFDNIINHPVRRPRTPRVKLSSSGSPIQDKPCDGWSSASKQFGESSGAL